MRLQRPRAGARRLVAAGLAAGAVAALAHVAAPGPPPTRQVLVAAHDLPAGRLLSGADLSTVAWPADRVPDGALSGDDLEGRVAAGPLRRGEPLTDARVVGAGLLRGLPPGTVATALPLAAGLTGLAPGSRVDVLVAGGRWPLAADAVVLAVLPTDAAGGAGAAGAGLGALTSGSGRASGATPSSAGAVVLAVAPEEAQALVTASAAGDVAVTVRGG